jgi:hypothetical protein
MSLGLSLQTVARQTHTYNAWMVNDLSHVGTDDDAQVEARFGKLGVPQAQALLPSRMNTASFLRG